jgi:hypothetical protein
MNLIAEFPNFARKNRRSDHSGSEKRSDGIIIAGAVVAVAVFTWRRSEMGDPSIGKSGADLLKQGPFRRGSAFARALSRRQHPCRMPHGRNRQARRFLPSTGAPFNAYSPSTPSIAIDALTVLIVVPHIDRRAVDGLLPDIRSPMEKPVFALFTAPLRINEIKVLIGMGQKKEFLCFAALDYIAVSIFCVRVRAFRKYTRKIRPYFF